MAYLLRCADGSLYAGITNDIVARLAAHASGVAGAKYTRGRGPFVVVWRQRAASRSEASRIEWRVKRLTRAAKLRLVAKRGRIAISA